MGHNSVVSGHPESTGIPWVDGLSTGPPDLRCHMYISDKHKKYIVHSPKAKSYLVIIASSYTMFELDHALSHPHLS